MRMKRRYKFEKYFRGRVNRIWQIIYGKEEEEIKFSELSNFGDKGMLMLLVEVRENKQEEELTHGKDSKFTFSHMELKLISGQ